MSNVNCEVIEDILPLYVENMASPSTRALVDEHLASCEACKNKEAQMHQAVQFPRDVGITPLTNIRKRLFRKNVTIAAVTVLSMLLLAVLCIIHLNSPIAIPYEDIADSIEITTDENNHLLLSIKDSKGGFGTSEYGMDEDGVKVQYVSLYTTRLRQLQGMAGSYRFHILDASFGIPDEEIVRRVYFTPSRQNGEAVCIYEDEAVAGTLNGGVIVLPRLTLNYYTLFAALLTIAGIIICIFFRKQEKKFFIALKITLLPIVYVVSSIIVLWNKGAIYDVGYYFSGILIVTLVLYIMGYWIIECNVQFYL